MFCLVVRVQEEEAQELPEDTGTPSERYSDAYHRHLHGLRPGPADAEAVRREGEGRRGEERRERERKRRGGVTCN